jgi:hypothetical protein
MNQVQEYEELRRCITTGQTTRSSGLSLLVSRGMAAWLQLVSVIPSMPQLVSHVETSPALPEIHTRLRNEMVSVIANMMLRTTLEVAHAV